MRAFLPPLLSSLLLLVSASGWAAPSIVSFPSSLLLEEGASAEIVVRSDSEVRTNASVGRLVPVSTSGDEHHFRYEAPSSRAPAVALLAFWSDAHKGETDAPELTLLRLPLLGRTDLEVDTESNAEVTVEVGGRSFGPIKASRKGGVSIPIEVPPDARSAKVIARTGRLQTERNVPLDIPPFNPLLVAMGPDPLPPEGGWLWVIHEGILDGRNLELLSRGVRLERQKILRDRALFKIVPRENAKEVRVQARLSNDPAASAEQTMAVGTHSLLAGKITEDPLHPSKAGPEQRGSLELSAAVLGFYRGGANVGPGVALGAGWTFPMLSRRLGVELEVGLRRASLKRQTELGTVSSEILALPIELALRGRFFEAGALSLEAKLGGGVVPFRHRANTAMVAPITETAWGGEAFAGVNAGWTLGKWRPFVELRGAVGQTRTSRVVASVSGGMILLGTRFSP